MSAHPGRLQALRDELTRRELDGFIVPIADEHGSDYVGAYAKRLEWLTGFTGSAATAIVLKSSAAIFVDGRYTLQVREQVDTDRWVCLSVAETSIAEWLAEHAPKARIGYDPWLHTRSWMAATSSALHSRGITLVPAASNPIDAIWHDRPAPSTAPVAIYPLSLSGRASGEKRADVARWLSSNRIDSLVVTALDEIAWLLNVRGQDVTHTPVALAFVLIHADGTADLFVSPEKISPEVIAHLGPDVRVHARADFQDHLRGCRGKSVAIDPGRVVMAIVQALEQGGAGIVEARPPIARAKAVKNAAEIAGHRAAQLNDGVALCRFLHWLAAEADKGESTELDAARRLREMREQAGDLRSLSFETISAFGPHAAIVHYRPTPASNLRITPDGLYLIDSGGQYPGGTTDVTRTIAIGTPTAEMCERFTRVLRGHIALAQAVFKRGTSGIQLDVLARQYLWEAGLDYAHGTGHGVGSYLCVHEGPQRIARAMESEPLEPGMILSNEPGYYKAGEYGIRIENLMMVVEREIAAAEHPMLGFEVLTLAPIDRNLIVSRMLTEAELGWLDRYHDTVRRLIGPLLQGPARDWLIEVTEPLG